MPVSPDLTFQQLSPVQNASMPQPPTLASATTIAPTTALTVLSGTTEIANITPPIDGFHVLWFIPLAALPAFSIAGNIANAGSTSTANVPFAAAYNPVTKKYHILGKA